MNQASQELLELLDLEQLEVLPPVEDAVGRRRGTLTLPRTDLSGLLVALHDPLHCLLGRAFPARAGAQPLPDVPPRLLAEALAPHDHPAHVLGPGHHGQAPLRRSHDARSRRT